jgi:polar amino acid transport system substrate-binding protein/glutamate/aspartate transport system substrate-binding protein
VQYVSVNAANRFDAIRKGQADLLCEATTETLDRRKTLDFSIPTFISGASVIIQAGGPTNLEDMAGKKIAVLTGTTTEQALLTSLKEGAIQADVIPVATHQQGMDLVENGKVAAYFAERVILQYMQRASKSGAKLQLSNYLTYEPYALALPYGDEEFRLAVDRALSDLYRSGAITAVFTRSFGPEAAPTQVVRDLYIISALPE